MIFDVEYSIGDNFLIFSRFNINMINGEDIKYNTDMVIDTSMNHDDVKILENYIKMNAKEQLYRINFGIRYKI